MKIVVTGATGQLGYDVCQVLNERGIENIGLGSKDCDIGDEAEVKANFDRVLNAVKEEAMKRNGYLVGKIEEALVEEINAHDDTYLTGRLSNNSMVHFKGDASLIGKLVNVNILEAKGFYYMGEMI